MRKERVGALKAFGGLRKCAPSSPLMKSDEGHGGACGALWKAEKKVIHTCWIYSSGWVEIPHPWGSESTIWTDSVRADTELRVARVTERKKKREIRKKKDPLFWPHMFQEANRLTWLVHSFQAMLSLESTKKTQKSRWSQLNPVQSSWSKWVCDSSLRSLNISLTDSRPGTTTWFCYFPPASLSSSFCKYAMLKPADKAQSKTFWAILTCPDLCWPAFKQPDLTPPSLQKLWIQSQAFCFFFFKSFLKCL